MALKPCRSCGQMVDWEAKACPSCGAKHPGISRVVYALIGLVGLLALGWCASAVAQEDPFQWMQKPGESLVEWDRRLDADASVRERIGCLDAMFVVRVIVPGDSSLSGGEYELTALDQSSITMCGWKTNMFEMFVVDRTGCMVKKKHRWLMNNIDAKRVRECFERKF